jgi:hypothetical protein
MSEVQVGLSRALGRILRRHGLLRRKELILLAITIRYNFTDFSSGNAVAIFFVLAVLKLASDRIGARSGRAQYELPPASVSTRWRAVTVFASGGVTSRHSAV